MTDHLYTFERDLQRMPDMDDTPEKPCAKKVKDEPSLLEIQENIITLLSKKIYESSGHLENLIRENTLSIGTLKKSIDFALNEVKDLKDEMKAVKEITKSHEQKVAELERKVNEAERYRRRWNLRLHGVPEKTDEDLKHLVIGICGSVAPELKERCKVDVDIVYRLGRKEHGRSPRTTIIQFTNRSTRDLLWKRAKNCEFLQAQHLWFTEDLTALDVERRKLLWPMVKDAREKGRKAFFVGIRAFVDGV